MPALKNPKHERYVQGRIQGMTIDDAYVYAGYERNSGNAARLNGNESIRKRLEELLAAVEDDTICTLEDHIKQLVGLRDAAFKDGKYSAAVKAEELRGKVSGHYIDRVEHGGPGEFARMTKDELAVYIANEAREIGLGGQNLPAQRASGKSRSQLN